MAQAVEITLRAYTVEDRPLLRHMAELYAYDFSEMTGSAIGSDGRFIGESWFDSHFLTAFAIFLIYHGSKPAGFALVADKSQLTDQAGVYDVLQFFVLRAYRKHGVGAVAAQALFDRFPGSWEVRQIDDNPAAHSFWRRVVARYSRGAFSESAWQEEDCSGVVQRFQAPGPAGVSLSPATDSPLCPSPVPLTIELRPARLTDAAALLAFEQTNRAYFERHIDSRGDDFYSLVVVEQSLREAEVDDAQGTAYRYLIWRGATLVGRLNFTHVERKQFYSAQLGYRVAETEAGRGVASEALRLGLLLAFGKHRLQRIEATAAAYNAGSQRVLEKNGFRCFGRSQHSLLHDGNWHDLLYFERHIDLVS